MPGQLNPTQAAASDITTHEWLRPDITFRRVAKANGARNLRVTIAEIVKSGDEMSSAVQPPIDQPRALIKNETK